MSVMKRMRDISVATLNDRLERSENPVALIDSYLYAQRDKIAESDRLFQQCSAHAAQMRNQYLTAHQTAGKREEQAALALKAGEESVARIALQDKLANEEKAEQYRGLYEQAQHSLIELEQQLTELRNDYQEVLDKRQYYAARLQAVRLQQQMNQSLQSQRLNGSAFQRLEERITDMEWESKSLGEIRRSGRELMLEAGTALKHTLDAELERLKKKMEKEG